MSSLKNFDEKYKKVIVGVDEAGRGPLAGPVIAAAVIVHEYFPELSEINDSKKLTEKKREKLYNLIMEKCVVGIGSSDEMEIDSINILNATFSAMKRAVEKIEAKYDIILVDGNHKIRGYEKEQEAIVKGDSKSLSIAAASIVAKVTRDRLLLNMDKEFPEYGFARHKGYGTKLHREMIISHGPCKYHRKSFLTKILENVKI